MMNNTLKSQVCKVPPGTVISGKWHKKSYRIVRSLGYGANGIVYLAESLEGPVALKISENSTSITSEVNVLKHFSKVQGSALGPSLLDVDDWIRKGYSSPISFYVMEYISGDNFLSFLQKRGKEWTIVLCLQLLSDLDRLHQEGWVFGDLKPDNLIVSGNPPKIRCVDVGGTTLQGRAIKEFTEFFDRGYWGAGSRKAEPSYDLFAVAMIMINASYPNRFTKSDQPVKQLKNLIQNNDTLRKLETVLLNAIDGKYQHASEMRRDLLEKVSHTVHKSNPSTQRQTFQTPSKKQTRVTRKQQVTKKKGGVFETILLLVFVSLGYLLYLYGQIL
ncbi:protein kinase domain-containing protein [Ferdinandcohnia quinoae]|uniref:Protein kinase family protein n=1 Tax=Fredinandcohnia quinoae TaxID=2918902 RepID=A0AAW5E3H2_9BACI|nr:protein kinase family protein [Fredinandcohnia sp. SECRCQ15]MCH1626923.1 protein kinase family protein [Fredinandcohnia sp. SECRCQ15]